MDYDILFVCLGIFFCRVLDVTFNTVRTIQVIHGNRASSAFFAFLECMLWFLVSRQALTSNMTGVEIAISYAAGYATGTYAGGTIMKIFDKSKICMQVITSSRNEDIVDAIREQGYAVSVLEVKGSKFGCEKYLLYIQVDNKKQARLKWLIDSLDNRAFVSVQENKMVYNGYFSSMPGRAGV